MLAGMNYVSGAKHSHFVARATGLLLLLGYYCYYYNCYLFKGHWENKEKDWKLTPKMIVKQGEQSRKQASDLLYILARQKKCSPKNAP